MKKPKILEPYDKVGIAAATALFDPEDLKGGINSLERAGLKSFVPTRIEAKDFIYSGTVAHRVHAVETLLFHPQVKAIWFIRGGYGAWPVADELTKIKPPKTSKIFLGSSDITAIHLAVMQSWNWPVLHSPLLGRLANPKMPKVEWNCILSTILDTHYRLRITTGLKSLNKKDTVVAPVTGGNLSLLATSIGTPWEVQTKGKILFIEEIGERAYRIDRMLYQLRAAGKFENIKGLVFGDFTECIEPNKKELWQEVIKRNFSHAPFPVVEGVRAGHGSIRLTLPLGIKAKLTSKGKPCFEYVESFAKA